MRYEINMSDSIYQTFSLQGFNQRLVEAIGWLLPTVISGVLNKIPNQFDLRGECGTANRTGSGAQAVSRHNKDHDAVLIDHKLEQRFMFSQMSLNLTRMGDFNGLKDRRLASNIVQEGLVVTLGNRQFT